MALSLNLLDKWMPSNNKKAMLRALFKAEFKNCSNAVGFEESRGGGELPQPFTYKGYPGMGF